MSDELIFDLQKIGLFYRKSASLPWKSHEFLALKDVSLKVYRGETLGIIGRNGAGKSTLLKILAGIIRPDLGSIWRANVSVTMQSVGAGFDPRLTGRQNIFLNGLLLGMHKKQIDGRVDDIIALAEIGEFIDQPVKHYSSGMRARLGFSIAFFVDTDVILIDEALGAGDEMFRKKASKLIKEKIKGDHTVVLVSHSMNLVNQLCNRVIQVENGYSLVEQSVKLTLDRYLGQKKQKAVLC